MSWLRTGGTHNSWRGAARDRICLPAARLFVPVELLGHAGPEAGGVLHALLVELVILQPWERARRVMV